MPDNTPDQRRNVTNSQFNDQTIINQGTMGDIHYHQPHLPSRADGACAGQYPLPGPHFVVPFRENKRFVGREDILGRLKDKLLGDDRPRSLAVFGLGGVGKTQVALQIAYHIRNQPGWSVIWLSALSMVAFEASCTEAVEKLRLPKSGTEDAKKVVKWYLESTTSGCWLLIVDNADDVATLMKPLGIYQYLPNDGNGCIIFTTRTMEVALAVAEEAEELEEMSEDDAKGFLKQLLPGHQEDGELVKELLITLTFLPLAISQAAAYIKRNTIPVSKYLSLLRDVDREAIGLLSQELPDRTRYSDSRHAAASTWLVSFEQIQRNDETAAELLLFLSHIEPRAIPELMLPRTNGEHSLVNAIGTLCGYNFLSRRGDGDMLDMHSLVHLAARSWVRGEGKEEAVKRHLVSHLATVFCSAEWEHREVWRKYLPHVLKLIQVSEKEAQWGQEESYLGFWAGRCLWVEGRMAEAVQLLEHVVKTQEAVLAEDHPNRLASQHTLAVAYESNGQVKEAVQLLEHMVKIQEAVLAEDHPYRLASQHALAGAYESNGQVKEAVHLLEHVVKIQEAVLAEDHPNRLASQHALAGAYESNGQVKEAVHLLEHVVKIQEAVLAEDHPNRLASQHALAGAYESNGQVKEAVHLLEHVVKIQEAVLAEDHPNRLASQHALAGAYESNGQVKEAVQLLEHMVKIQEAVLAEGHPNRLASQHALAGAYESNGQVKEAVQLLEHVVTIESQIMAPSNPLRQASERLLAEIQSLSAA